MVDRAETELKNAVAKYHLNLVKKLVTFGSGVPC